jgi:dTDP-4-dehydrorhamnose 3,5-epimerase
VIGPQLEVSETPIHGLLNIQPRVFGDARGFFVETYSARAFENAGISCVFKQDNLSKSTRGVLRGLHFQCPNPQAKLVSVVEGEVFDVAVDLRLGSPTFGKWYGVTLSGEKKNQLLVPRGMAHGFITLTDTAIFSYKVDDFYSPQDELCLRWDDPEVGIKWPDVSELKLSDKDKNGTTLKDIPRDRLLRFS